MSSTQTELHRDRDRAESFGADADRYDRYRPAIPHALVERLLATEPSTILDVACGTAKSAAPFVDAGVAVLGVEPDARMAALAKAHGVQVEVAKFEEWDDAGRRFDLVTCGNAWHWLTPAKAADKAAKVVRPGGMLARFYSYFVLEPDVVADLATIYEAEAPDAHRHGSPPRPGELAENDVIAGHPAFTQPEIVTHATPHELTADAWVGLLYTYSDHRRMGPERFAVLEAELRRYIAGRGGSLTARAESFALLARRR
jgi:SAM-dependent methyltransferase